MSVRHQLKVLPEDAVAIPNLRCSPSEVAKKWSTDVPLIALIANGEHDSWSRWSILAKADGPSFMSNSTNVIDDLGKLLESKSSATLLPNWIGYLSYECAHVVEPVIGEKPEQDWALAHLVWCDTALVYDHLNSEWWSIGQCEVPAECQSVEPMCECSPLMEVEDDDTFKDTVVQTIEYIHQGDIFQANITRRYTASIQGNVRHAALNMLETPGGWFGAWLEFPRTNQYLLSMSPELFLTTHHETQRVLTRPMKGTRPEHASPEELLDSDKDAAELHMIVDLMRNDLGRLCNYGSIQVESARALERHPTVWQCVGEVSGTLRSDVTAIDVIRSTFPAGSVTGAPKVRAMEIIRKLESSPRGPYCGAIGIFGQSLHLNVAIRTAMIQGDGDACNFHGNLTYSTGCGIVADSNPDDEVQESKVKAAIMSQFTKPLTMRS